jgi:hypothetical protein
MVWDGLKVTGPDQPLISNALEPEIDALSSCSVLFPLFVNETACCEVVSIVLVPKLTGEGLIESLRILANPAQAFSRRSSIARAKKDFRFEYTICVVISCKASADTHCYARSCASARRRSFLLCIKCASEGAVLGASSVHFFFLTLRVSAFVAT